MEVNPATKAVNKVMTFAETVTALEPARQVILEQFEIVSNYFVSSKQENYAIIQLSREMTRNTHDVLERLGYDVCYGWTNSTHTFYIFCNLQ